MSKKSVSERTWTRQCTNMKSNVSRTWAFVIVSAGERGSRQLLSSKQIVSLRSLTTIGYVAGVGSWTHVDEVRPALIQAELGNETGTICDLGADGLVARRAWRRGIAGTSFFLSSALSESGVGLMCCSYISCSYGRHTSSSEFCDILEIHVYGQVVYVRKPRTS